MIYLETPRVVLKFFGLGDENLLFDLDSDPVVMTYLTDGKPTPMEECKNGLARILKNYSDSKNRYGLFPAYEKTQGKFMGWFQLRPGKKAPDNFSEIEIGYRLKRTYWGQGFATEVSQALLKKAFEQGAQTVFATTMRANLGSQRVMQKIGLKFSRYYVENEFPGADKGAVRYELALGELRDPI